MSVRHWDWRETVAAPLGRATPPVILLTNSVVLAVTGPVIMKLLKSRRSCRETNGTQKWRPYVGTGGYWDFGLMDLGDLE